MTESERLSMAAAPGTAWVEFNLFGTGADIMAEGARDWLKDADAQSTDTLCCVDPLD